MHLIYSLFKIFSKIIPYKFKTFYKKNFRKFNGLKKIDEKMLKFINYNNGYYIEMGAHDGVHNSNTLYYEKNKNWTGILIEPSSYYNFLIKNRSKKNKFFNVACSQFGSSDETILLGNADYSFCKNLVNKKFSDWYLTKQKQINKKIVSKRIKLKTLNSILLTSCAPKLIDFFSLDVEGMEMNVIKGINFNMFNFKYFLIECTNQHWFFKINKFLIKKNYTYICNLTPWDYLFKFKK